MWPLEQAQLSLAQTLAHGPNHLEPGLFAGPLDRVLLGLKAHANTISHARLVALEETFPLTRAAIGAEAFNHLSRAYLDMPFATSRPLLLIGSAFPSFLASGGEPAPVIDLARAEWAWLLAYHAAEALPFALASIAGQPAETILETPVQAHPAAHVLTLAAPAGPALASLGDVAGARILLFSRPQADVLVTAIEPAERALFARLHALGGSRLPTVGTLFARLLEEAPDEDLLAAFLRLAQCGALAHPERILP